MSKLNKTKTTIMAKIFANKIAINQFLVAKNTIVMARHHVTVSPSNQTTVHLLISKQRTNAKIKKKPKIAIMITLT